MNRSLSWGSQQVFEFRIELDESQGEASHLKRSAVLTYIVALDL